MFKEPKNTETVKWTQHIKEKMMFYGLSETKIRYVLRKPDRIEEGIALRTTAVMQRTGSKKSPSEIWVMYQLKKSQIPNPKSQRRKEKNLRGILARQEKIIVISAWRYPGISPQGPPPIPEDIIREMEGLL